jgi:hypothetical protein
MSRLLAKMMEMHRKQQLMAKKKSAQAALSFESPPPAKSHTFKSPFTPPRTAADIIGATQANEDFERDSLASQSFRTTARIWLQEKYVKVATLYKDELSPDEIKEPASATLPPVLWRSLQFTRTFINHLMLKTFINHLMLNRHTPKAPPCLSNTGSNKLSVSLNSDLIPCPCSIFRSSPTSPISSKNSFP